MNQTDGTTLMSFLREAVRERHARMESLPFVAALTSGTLPLESYVGQLRAMAVIQATLEHECAQTDVAELKALIQERPSRLVHARKDLSVFDSLHIPDIGAAVEQTRRIAEWIRLCRVEQPADLLGILYVLQGTTLGNTVHLPDVLRILSGPLSEAVHYYAGYGDQTAAYWQEFTHAMNAFPLEQSGYEHQAEVALEFFDRLEALFSALYPLESAALVYTAGMLNPEAGEHAVPQDVREIDAATVAARKCREEFPYFDERYKERGQGFARSDTAWLVTLTTLPVTELLAQVEWLGRILSNRGMPRITLERQLELLHAELSAAVPARSEQYTLLQEAAVHLKKQRVRFVPEQQADTLTREFSAGTDHELQGRFRRSGALIVSAVCDEAAGITGAVTSLLPWLTDAERFPPQWVAAVLTILEQARAAVESRNNP